MKKYIVVGTLISLKLLFAQTDTGCSIANMLEKPNRNSLLQTKEGINCSSEGTTLISPKMKSVKVLHENEELVIERKVKSKAEACPPFCIQPIKIKSVETVGELEVLAFIDKLKEKKARLLIDVRKNIAYLEGTIPGAINLPLFMLEDKSKYQKEVLELLGAKKRNSKWLFRNAQSLLIFGTSATNNEAADAIKKLLELGYPSEKLLYYRDGISQWRALGLTTY